MHISKRMNVRISLQLSEKGDSVVSISADEVLDKIKTKVAMRN